MATIKIRRGSGQPSITGTGLTAYEPAWDTTNNRFFINTGSTAMWIGAAVIQDTTLSGNCAWTIPTQNSVKTYVDNQVSAGAVSSINGATGAVTIGGGTGISIATSTAARGITIGVNSNVALLDTAQTFTALQTFSAGICASGATFGSTVSFGLSGFVSSNIILRADTNTISAPGNNKIGITTGDTAFGLFVQNSTNANQINIKPFSKEIEFYEFSSGSSVILNSGTMVAGTTYTVTLPGYGTILAGLSGTQTFTGTKSFSSLANFSAGISASGATFSGNINAPNLVTSVDGVTGAVDLLAGSGISITVPTGAAKGITLANTGVLSIASGNTAISFNASTGTVTGTFNGVHTVAGTANQISASSSTGSVTLSLPSAVTMPGSLTVTGDLTVNGTTTTVNSTTVTVQDPLIAIGGVTANAPPPVGDTKDRGILFQWGDGTAGRTGFFGLDRSTGRFTFLPLGVSVSGEVVTGTAGNAEFSGVFAPQGILNLTGLSGSNASVTIAGSSAGESTSVAIKARTTTFGVDSSLPILALNDGNGVLGKLQLASTLTAERSYSLPNWSGQVGVWATSPLQGRILLGDVSGSPPYWADPTSSGFTAFAATNAENLRLTATSSNTNFNLTFATGNSGLQLQYADLSNNLTWNPSSATMVLAGGKGFLEGIIEGGTF